MKKIYFFLLAIIFPTVLFAQDCVDDIEPPVLSCPADTVVDMDEGEMGAFVNIPGITKKVDVILLFSDYTEYGRDVQSKLIATGNFSTVDISNIAFSTPSLSVLLNYDAVLIWRLSSFFDPVALGNVLADYIDTGGGLVIGALATSDVSYPSGTFVTNEYDVIVPGPIRYGPQAFLGDVHLPGHPLMNGITSFDGGLNSYRSTNNNLTTGSYRIADWTDGLPLIAAKENVGPAKARRVDINFFPPTLTTYGTSAWDENTDGDLIMANALTWVAGAAIAYDNCKLVNVTNDFNNSSSLSDFYPVGTTLVTVTATDVALNSSTCSFSVTVISPEPPTAVCQNITVELDENGQVAIEAADVDGGSTPTVYPIDTMTIEVETFDCSMIGENPVVLTVTDEIGNSSTCTAVVTVNDAEAPVAVCKDGGNSKVLLLWDEDNANTQSLKAAIEAEGYTVTVPAVPEYQWDNTNPPLDDFDAVVHLKGTTWTSPMSISAQNALVDFVTVQGKAFIHSEWDAYEIDDMNAQNAMSEITILQRYSGSTSDLTYTVVSGMESHPVLKDIPTSFTISNVGYSPSNLRSYVSNPAEMLMTDQNGTAAVAIRDFGKGKVVGFNHAGNYAGSSALSNALVQQLYINALNWAAKGVFKLDDTGTVIVTPEEIDGGSYDDCSGIASMELDKTTFTTDDIGEQEVTLTVTDEGGNTSSCTSTITITSSDNEVPQVVANPIEVYLDETGKYVLNQDDIEAIADGTTDNLTPFEDLKLVAYPKIFVCANVGEVIHLRLTVEDADGNKAKQWTTVTVLDTISPVAVCKNIDVYLDENGQSVITPEQVNDTTTYDACGVESLVLDKFIFSCADLGENAVTLTVTDLSGNVATCTATVMVYDTLPPTPVVVADVELEVEPGVCETAVEYPEAMFTENCGVVLEQTAGLGPDGIFPLGTTTETWVATDDAGNTAEISFNVIVTTINALPTLSTITNVIADEDTPPVTVELTGISYGVDCAEQVVTVTALADNAVLVSSVTVEYANGEPTGSVMLTLAPDMNGTSDVTVTVEDSEGAMVSKTFTVTVNPVNDAPFVVNPVPDQVVNASYVLKIPLSPALGIVFDDVDDAVLAFGIMEEGGGALPGWATIVGDTLVCTPMIADTGCVNLVVKATDAAGASASDTFIVCVDGYPVSSPLVNESAFDVKMYPNPTNGRVNIEINNAVGITDVSVYSITGKEILRKNFYNNKIISFSMNEFVSGMYLVKMNIEGKQIVKKLVLDKK